MQLLVFSKWIECHFVRVVLQEVQVSSQKPKAPQTEQTISIFKWTLNIVQNFLDKEPIL